MPLGCLEAGSKYDEVACQVIGFYETTHRHRQALTSVPFVDVRYEELCAQPALQLERIAEASRAAGIQLTERTNEIPEFSASVAPGSDINPDSDVFGDLFADVDWDRLWS